MSLLCACGVKVKSPARPGRYACPRCRQALVFPPPAAPPPPPQEPPPATPAPPRTRSKVWWGLGALVLIVLAVAGNSSKKAPTVEKKKGAERTTTTKTERTANKTQRVTIEMYNNIKEGMSYDQVREIIGFDGEELSRNNLAGTTTVMYQWMNQYGSNMNAIFQGDALVNKAQFGLK